MEIFDTLAFFLTGAPLYEFTELVLLIVRITVGGIMLYFGIEKLRDLKAHYRDFAENGFRPVWLTGTLILLTETLGGIAILLGLLVPLAAIAVAFEMFVGTFIKMLKWKNGFGDYSYDILIFVLCLVLLAFGPGTLSLFS